MAIAEVAIFYQNVFIYAVFGLFIGLWAFATF